MGFVTGRCFVVTSWFIVVKKGLHIVTGGFYIVTTGIRSVRQDIYRMWGFQMHEAVYRGLRLLKWIIGAWDRTHGRLHRSCPCAGLSGAPMKKLVSKVGVLQHTVRGIWWEFFSTLLDCLARIRTYIQVGVLQHRSGYLAGFNVLGFLYKKRFFWNGTAIRE